MDELNHCIGGFLNQGFLLYASSVIGLTLAALWILFRIRERREKKMSQPQCQLIYKFRR